jgi:hypothetical protein
MQSLFYYSVYGVALRSEFALSLPEHSEPALLEIELRVGSPAALSQGLAGIDLQHRSDWYHYAHLEDRSSYVRWIGLGEFLVSPDGRRITCARAP